MRVVSVVGARPNFMKIAPLARAFSKMPSIDHKIVHTGQHYDEKMSDVFFRDLEIPTPDVFLGVGSGSHAQQTADIMIRFEKACHDLRPDAVLVVGDVNSTAACAMVAAKLVIPIIHVEAGLRSFDRAMPEEINRVVTDALSDQLFVTEESGVQNLMREGKRPDQIFKVGNVMIDSLIHAESAVNRSGILESMGVQGKGFAVATIHRPSNVDDPAALAKIVEILADISKRFPVVFPVHPRTSKALRESSFDLPGVLLCDPMPYTDFLALLKNAAVVLTDSGGVQEETTYLRVPCITLRTTTERPVTVEVGTNIVIGLDRTLLDECLTQVECKKYKKGTMPDLWDGHAAERIVSVIAETWN